jgi:predicted transcriptional regulator YdeE
MENRAVSGFDVVGFSTRTKNEDESNPSTAKIGQLWDIFYSQAASKLGADSLAYGVYCNYETDHSGMFDVFACSDSKALQELSGTRDLSIEPGQYLTFSATGKMPQAVIDLWAEVWNHFSADNCEHTRAYTTDFECYKSANEVEISISIK